MMRLGSYQAVARGANGVMFFQWRASRTGSEKFHSAMVPHTGTDTRTWQEVKALGNELRGLDPLLDSRVKADVAILFDWINWWALEGDGKPSNDVKMLPGVLSIYSELFRRNVAVDFVHPEGHLSPYRLVIAPHLSGIVDQNDRVLTGGYPALFRKTLGLWVEDFAALAEGQINTLRTSDEGEFGCDLWIDIIHPEGAQTLAVYTDDYLAGIPAITRHPFGKGRSFYVGTQPGRDGLAWLMDQVLGEAGVKPVLAVPSGIEVTRRGNGANDCLFLLNYSDEAVDIELPGSGIDLITGAAVSSSIRLGPVDVAVVRMAAR
jgi:beta-galactosidase